MVQREHFFFLKNEKLLGYKKKKKKNAKYLSSSSSISTLSAVWLCVLCVLARKCVFATCELFFFRKLNFKISNRRNTSDIAYESLWRSSSSRLSSWCEERGDNVATLTFALIVLHKITKTSLIYHFNIYKTTIFTHRFECYQQAHLQYWNSIVKINKKNLFIFEHEWTLK